MPASSPRDSSGLRDIYAAKIQRAQIATWRRLHAEDDGMMYALPADDRTLWSQLSRCNAHLAFDGVDCLVGGFTLTLLAPGLASVGIMVERSLRRSGYGAKLMGLVEETARALGVRTLRADVYAENAAAIALLQGQGFREFVWLEKNL